MCWWMVGCGRGGWGIHLCIHATLTYIPPSSLPSYLSLSHTHNFQIDSTPPPATSWGRCPATTASSSGTLNTGRSSSTALRTNSSCKTCVGITMARPMRPPGLCVYVCVSVCVCVYVSTCFLSLPSLSACHSFVEFLHTHAHTHTHTHTQQGQNPPDHRRTHRASGTTKSRCT